MSIRAISVADRDSSQALAPLAVAVARGEATRPAALVAIGRETPRFDVPGITSLIPPDAFFDLLRIFALSLLERKEEITSETREPVTR